MVTGVLTSVASDWDKFVSDLLRIRHLPLVEFSADPTIRNIRHVRVRDSRNRSPLHVPVAREPFPSS